MIGTPSPWRLRHRQQSATLTFNASSGGLLKILLYTDPAYSGPTLYSIPAVNQETIVFTSLAAGTYYVRVYGYSAPMTYSLSAHRPSRAQCRH